MAASETQTGFCAVIGFVERRWWYAGAVAGALLLAAAFYFDATVAGWIVQHQTRAGIAFMRNVSNWGDWPSHVLPGAIGLAIACGLGSRPWRAIFLAMVVACAVAGFANSAIKLAAGRSRPSVKIDAGWNGPSLKSNYHAFPSGHTASSTAFFAVLCFARRRIGLALLPIPLLIATSRIYLNAHYLSDVVFAAMLGVLCALVAWRFVRRRFGEHRAQTCIRLGQ